MRIFELHQLIVLITVIFLFCIAEVEASDPALELGDYLFTLQSYDEAITEYKRFLFFHPNDPRVSGALYKIGLAYRSEGHWAEALEAMNTSIQQTADAELRAERSVELAVTLIASGNYNLALIELIRVETQTTSDRLRQRTRFLQGVAYLYLFNWEQARKVFRVYFDAMPHSEQKAKIIDTLFEEAIHRPQKSEAFAKILSTILPGVGQTYAGDWRNGLNALVLNGLLGFVSVDAAIDKRYDDSALYLLVLFQRYYLGNRHRAGESAKQFNEKSDRQHAAKILHALSLQD